MSIERWTFERRIRPETLAHFLCEVDKNGNLEMPVHSTHGEHYFTVTRNFDGGAKYVVSPSSAHSSLCLYGLPQAFNSVIIGNCITVVEGPADVFVHHQSKIHSCVSSLSARISTFQANLLSLFADTVYVLFDGDAAGEEAAKRISTKEIFPKKTKVLAATIVGHDPASYYAAGGDLRAVRHLMEQYAQSLSYVRLSPSLKILEKIAKD